jgi:hypothetical protein
VILLGDIFMGFEVEYVNVLRSERMNTKNRIDFRIIKWKNSEKAVLEKRQIWEKEDGEIPTKLQPLTASDVKYIYENYIDLINLL